MAFGNAMNPRPNTPAPTVPTVNRGPHPGTPEAMAGKQPQQQAPPPPKAAPSQMTSGQDPLVSRNMSFMQRPDVRAGLVSFGVGLLSGQGYGGALGTGFKGAGAYHDIDQARQSREQDFRQQELENQRADARLGLDEQRLALERQRVGIQAARAQHELNNKGVQPDVVNKILTNANDIFETRLLGGEEVDFDNIVNEVSGMFGVTLTGAPTSPTMGVLSGKKATASSLQKAMEGGFITPDNVDQIMASFGQVTPDAQQWIQKYKEGLG